MTGMLHHRCPAWALRAALPRSSGFAHTLLHPATEHWEAEPRPWPCQRPSQNIGMPRGEPGRDREQSGHGCYHAKQTAKDLGSCCSFRFLYSHSKVHLCLPRSGHSQGPGVPREGLHLPEDSLCSPQHSMTGTYSPLTGNSWVQPHEC